jgi:protoheme IX farnesyltransferase
MAWSRSSFRALPSWPRVLASVINVMPDSIAAARAQSTVREYVALTKPGILSLLLFTTLCGMMVAAEGAPALSTTILTLIGGLLAAGGANALNCYIDRDIDGIMGRTSKRGTVTGTIPPRSALTFGLSLSISSLVVLGFGVNWLAAGLAAAGNVYYVVVYTLMLKRRTPQNIVIGGAAGAFPPLVGWAAVENNLAVLPVLMFAIIYYWTPPHFWALALLKQGDYGRAAVPMLPNIVGEDETRRQVLLYTVILTAVSLMPVAFGLGEIYFVSASLLGGLFLLWAARLYFQPSKRLAREMLFYSLWYLALIFGAMVVDRTVLG